MNFFNPKEEVLDIQLTPYGRRLLASGEFRPEYYAFFDDDVVYDGKSAGVVEVQNNAQKRIKEDTPRLKVQTVHEGINTFLQHHVMEGGVPQPTIPALYPIWYGDQGTADPRYAHQTLNASETYMGIPLGESSLSGNVAPAWNVKFYHNTLMTASTTTHLENAVTTLRIPQINVTIKPETLLTYAVDSAMAGSQVFSTIQDKTKNLLSNGYPVMDEDFVTAESLIPMGYEPPPDRHIEADGPVYNDLKAGPYDDQGVVMVKQDGVFLDVGEDNVDFLRENFDIEVFLIEDEKDEYGNKIRESSTKLFFAGDEVQYGEEITRNCVEYWLDILVDRDIAPQAYCAVGVPETSKQTPLDYVLGCPDHTPRSQVQLRDFYSVDEEPDPELC